MHQECHICLEETMEFSLNGTGIHWIHQIQGIWYITEAWIGVSFKDPVSNMCLAGACSLTQEVGGWVAGSSPFTVMKNIFVTEFSTFSENILAELK